MQGLAKNGATKKYRGLTKTTTTRSYRGTNRQARSLPASQQRARRRQEERVRTQEIQALPQDEQDAVMAMDVDTDLPGASIDDLSYPSYANCPPPGEEACEMSHEGGEFEVFAELVEDIAQIHGRKRGDDRPRTDRIENESSHWQLQMEHLVGAFLEYRSRDCGDGFPSSLGPDELLPLLDEGVVLSIDALDTFTRRKLTIRPFLNDQTPNQSLLHYGYLGGSPLHPTAAFSIRLLELYRQSHRTCPQFSIEAQCKTLCHMHNVPYREYLQKSFSSAYDAYLEIQRRVDRQLETELGYHTTAERIRRLCPPCFYALKDEPKLEFSCLVSVDGNSSLKRLDASVRDRRELQDSRVLEPDRWINSSEVDIYKDESKDLHADEDAPEAPDVPARVSDAGPLSCRERWKNAGPEDRKKMFALFDEAGIFIASCRHRMVLAACDMIKTGEQTKYPLAVLDRLIDVIGPNIGCAYDIGCSFDKTLHKSTLAGKASRSNIRMMVGSFHGHAHNRACQVYWHPLYISGTGLTEGEGCEQVFSSSNNLARGTRHASRFHRHQTIEEHFQFWDKDKYANLSTFITNHYNEAMKIVHSHEHDLRQTKQELSLHDDDFEHYLKQERQYLADLKPESPEGNAKIRYVKALRELSECRQSWSDTRAAANHAFTTPGMSNLHETLNLTRRQVETAFKKLQNAEEFVSSLETMLNISERWTTTSPEYIEYHQQTVLTNYADALDKLERLVVMRLFELTKVGQSGTGYRLRQQIGKALQRRSAAIKTAINQYNTEAGRLNPPRQALTWKEIVDYSFLAEFDLLRESNTGRDIRTEAWAQPSRREATVKYFKLARAREELVRLEVEIRRLCTSIHDEEGHVTATINHLSGTNSHLALELKRRWQLRSAINKVHLQKLHKLSKSRGLKDVCQPGTSLEPLAHPCAGEIGTGLGGATFGHTGSDTGSQSAAGVAADAERDVDDGEDHQSELGGDGGDGEDLVEAFAEFVLTIND